MRNKLLIAGFFLMVVCGLAFLAQENPGKDAFGDEMETVPLYQSVAIVPTRAQIGVPVQFKGAVAAFETKTIAPSGGTYTLNNGIALEVPAGAVSQNTTIGLRRLEKDEVDPILQSYGKLKKHFLAGFVGVPRGLAFNTPIKVTLPSARLEHSSELPYHFIVDPEKGIYSMFPYGQANSAERTTLGGVTGQEDWIVTYSDNTQSVVVDLKKLPPADVIAAAEDFITRYDCRANNCCSPVQVFANGEDITQTDFCFEQGVSILVRFPNCPGQPQFEEILGEMKKGAVEIVGDPFMINVGNTSTVTAKVTDAEGKTFYGPAVVWSSDNPAVATIGSLNGVLKAVAPGKATITADVGCDTKDTALVTVLTPVNSVVVDPVYKEIYISDQTTLKAIVKDKNGNIITNFPITWSCNNETIAAINPKTGAETAVTGIATGEVKITATCGGQKGEATVKVLGNFYQVVIDPASAAIPIYGSLRLKGKVVDKDGKDMNSTISWSSSDATIVYVIPNGSGAIKLPIGPEIRICGCSSGTATITASGSGQTAKVKIQVSSDIDYCNALYHCADTFASWDMCLFIDWNTGNPGCGFYPGMVGSKARDGRQFHRDSVGECSGTTNHLYTYWPGTYSINGANFYLNDLDDSIPPIGTIFEGHFIGEDHIEGTWKTQTWAYSSEGNTDCSFGGRFYAEFGQNLQICDNYALNTNGRSVSGAIIEKESASFWQKLFKPEPIVRRMGIATDTVAPAYFRRGINPDAIPVAAYPGRDGVIRIEIPEAESMSICLRGDAIDNGQYFLWKNGIRKPDREKFTAYSAVGNDRGPLPAGSTFDPEHGVFLWQPGPGLPGIYTFCFEDISRQTKQTVEVRIVPR